MLMQWPRILLKPDWARDPKVFSSCRQQRWRRTFRANRASASEEAPDVRSFSMLPYATIPVDKRQSRRSRRCSVVGFLKDFALDVAMTAGVTSRLGVVRYTAAKQHWRPTRKRLTAGATIAVAVLVVGLLNLHAYRTEYLKDDVRVNFQVPHPTQLGTNELALNFLILNKAQSSILLEETVAAEIASTDFSNNTFRDNAFCKLLPSWIAGRRVMDDWVHPAQAVLHHSVQKPAHFLDEANENWTTDPPFADDGKLDWHIMIRSPS